MLVSHWGKAVYPLKWPSLTKDLQTESKTVLCIDVVRQQTKALVINVFFSEGKTLLALGNVLCHCYRQAISACLGQPLLMNPDDYLIEIER